MTSPEHALIGIHVSLAMQFHRVCGWPAVAMAGVASTLPDWDGLAMLVDMSRFEAGHRVAGHNLLAISIAALLLGWTEARFRWLERVGSFVHRRVWTMRVDPATLAPVRSATSQASAPMPHPTSSTRSSDWILLTKKS